jgi:hypothetical protein
MLVGLAVEIVRQREGVKLLLRRNLNKLRQSSIVVVIVVVVTVAIVINQV